MLKSIFTYVIIAIVGTTLFFSLHYFGNQIPYEVAKQRFATAYKENNLRTVIGVPRSTEVPHPIGLLGGINNWDICMMSLAVLGEAKNEDRTTPFVDAVLLTTMINGISHPPTQINFCEALKRTVLEDAAFGKSILQPRYWWGAKAFYAIALRYFSVFEIQELTKTAIYFSYLLFAICLLRLAPKTLLLLFPLFVFGFFFSAIQYFPEPSSGGPYLGSILAATILTILIKNDISAHRLNIFCFIVGMVSSYLWIFDGHTMLIMSLIALVTYFTFKPSLHAVKRAKQTVLCILLYIIGFLVCFILGWATKIIVFEWVVSNPNLWSQLYGEWTQESGWMINHIVSGVSHHINNTNSVLSLVSPVVSTKPLIVGFNNIVYAFNSIVMEQHYTASKLLAFSSAFAFIGSLLFAVIQTYKGRPHWDILFIAGLMAFIGLQFLIPSSFPQEIGRFMFIHYALSWSCLIAAVMTWRSRLKSRSISD